MTADESMICSACGTAAEPGTRFCEHCGAKFDQGTGPSGTPPAPESMSPVQPGGAPQPQQTFAPLAQQEDPYDAVPPGAPHGPGGQAVPVMRIAKRRSKTPMVLTVIGVGLLALIIGAGIGFAVGWNVYRPAKLSQARAAQISADLSSGKLSQYEDAMALPKQAKVTAADLELDAKETYVLDASTFHFVNNKLGWVKLTAKEIGGTKTASVGANLGYVDGKWKLLADFLLASSD